MSTRERMERRLARRREWEESRERKSEQAWKAHHAVPLPEFGQPILVGHHSERGHRRALERSEALAFKALDHSKMAVKHAGKADNLETALETSIYSDDDDAIEALQARIAEREAERDRIKAYNASCRKGARDCSLLDAEQQAKLMSIAKHCPFQLGPKGQFPSYALSNLSGNIKRDRDRLEEIKRTRERQSHAEELGGVAIYRAPHRNWCTVTFAEKPEREIINALKAAGYIWGRGSWSGYLDRLPECVAELCTA